MPDRVGRRSERQVGRSPRIPRAPGSGGPGARPAAVLVAALALVAAGPASAVDLGEEWRLSGEAELGGRVVTGDEWSSAKYEEYRELRPGLFGEGEFLLENLSRGLYLRGWLDDVGERDESYRLEGGQWGHYRLGLEYEEVPHVFSNLVDSFLDDDGENDVFRLRELHPEGLDFLLRQTRADFHARPLEELEFDVDYRYTQRDGSRPWGIGFSNPGGNFVNFAAPIEERIQEVNSSLRWTEDTWTAEASYTASFFENRFERLRVENFGVLGEALGLVAFPAGPESGPDQGQISLEPENASHTFRLSGSTELPLGFASRLSATLAYGLRLQDQDFLCHTSNPALLPGAPLSDSCPLIAEVPTPGELELPADSLDGEVETFLANLVWTGRPHRRVSYTARYRFYDYSNDTRELTFPDHAENDSEIVEDTRISVANQYRRHNASLDVAVRPLDGVTLHLEPFWERWSRSDDREVERLYEWGGKVSADLRPAPWTQLHASYEFGIREADDHDAFAFLRESFDFESLSAVEREQVVFDELRKFDQADRERFKTQVIAQIVPREDVSFALNGSYGEQDFDNTDFGLTHITAWNVGGDVSWQPLDWLTVSSWYTYEETTYEQVSRWRPRGFFGPSLDPVDSPLNNWEALTEDQIDNFGTRLEVELVPDRVDLALGYEIQDSRNKSRASGVPGEVGVPAFGFTGGGDGMNFPGLRDTLQILSAQLDFHAREDLTLRLGYRYEKFDLKNFRIDDLDPVEPVSPTDLFLGDRIHDFQAHVIQISALWEF